MAQETLPWQPLLGSKLAKSDYSTLFVALAFQNGFQYRRSDFKTFICDDLATSCEYLAIFSPVTPRFIRVKASISARGLATFVWWRHYTEFAGSITTQFCFTYSLEGVTAMPRALHARLCHAFLVYC